jgi:hypothetical protein
VEKQAVTETEPEPLIELEEEMEYKKDNVVSLAQALKETIPAEFKERALQAIRDSAKIAEEGKRRLGDLWARLEFGLRDRQLQETCETDGGSRSWKSPPNGGNGKREENGGGQLPGH